MLTPILLTVAAFAVAIFSVPKSKGDYDFGPAFSVLFGTAAAIIFSLIVWLIWALNG